MSEDDPGVSDPEMRAMRAVWLSMRDEDPPERGMAALMAAARAQVAAPPREAWWQRVIGVMKRPPVLAMASVAILASGALLVAKRGGEAKLEAPDVAVRGEAEKTSMKFDRGEEPAEGGVAPADDGAGQGAAPAVNGVGAPAPRASAVRAGHVAAPANDGAANPRAVAVRAGDAPATEMPARRQGDAGPGGSAAPPPMSSSAAPAADDGAANDAQHRANATAAPPREVAANKADEAKPAAPVVGLVNDARASQLVEDCEAAAAKGDCATVKKLAAKIEKVDAGYRSRAPKRVVDCL